MKDLEEGIQNIDEAKSIEVEWSYVEKDKDFIHEILAISQKTKSTLKSIFDQSDIPDDKCEDIAEYAKIHAEANTFNSNSMVPIEKLKQKPDVICCLCGCRKGTGQNLPLCMNEQNLTFLGPGVLLFFFYLKHVRLMVLLLLIGFSSYSIISSILSNHQILFQDCLNKVDVFEKTICDYNSISTFSQKTSEFLRHVQLWIGCIFFTFWTIGIKLIEYLGEKKNQEIDNLLDSASDYTVRVENLPFGKVNEYEFIEFLQELWETREQITAENKEKITNNSTTQPLSLKSIQIIYNMADCRKLICKIQQDCLLIEPYLINGTAISKYDLDEYKSKKKSILQDFQDLKQLRNKFVQDKSYRKSISTTCALLQFESSKQQIQFLEYYGNPSVNFLETFCDSHKMITYDGNNISFTRAPEPSDFNWSNCEIKFSYLRYTIIWVITMFILYTAYAIVSFTQTFDIIKQFAGVLTSIIIQVFNRIIWISLSYLVTFEYQNTKTDAIISLMKKSIFAQVMNVVLAPMISKFLNNKPLYGENSVSAGSILYQFIMFFMMFIFYVANPMYYGKIVIISIKSLRNRMIRTLCQIVGEVDTVDEIRPVINFYEGPDFPIAGGYVYMTTAIIHTMFYCHLQPILFLILIFNMTGFYFIMKYLLLRRCKIPDLTDLQIFQCAISSVSYGALFYCFGSILFQVLESYEFPEKQFHIFEIFPTAICLFIWIILCMNPFHITIRIVQFLFNLMQFGEDFIKAEQIKTEIKIDDIFANLIMNSLENKKLLYQRKESYYKNCNTQPLFNYEAYLKEATTQEIMEREDEVQEFCQSFFKDVAYDSNFLNSSKGQEEERDEKFQEIFQHKKQKRKRKLSFLRDSGIFLPVSIVKKNRDSARAKRDELKFKPSDCDDLKKKATATFMEKLIQMANQKKKMQNQQNNKQNIQ